jgi:NADH dehydrogenase
VARILGLNFSGFFAWWLWRTVYLSKLPGLDKKVRVAFDWTLDLLFPKDVCAVHDLPARRKVESADEQRRSSLAETLAADQALLLLNARTGSNGAIVPHPHEVRTPLPT